MATMEENEKIMEEQFKLGDARLEVLMARTEVASAQVKIELRKRIDAIKAKRSMAQAQFDEFKAAGGGKWDNVKAGINAFSQHLEAAFKELIK